MPSSSSAFAFILTFSIHFPTLKKFLLHAISRMREKQFVYVVKALSVALFQRDITCLFKDLRIKPRAILLAATRKLTREFHELFLIFFSLLLTI